MNKRFPFGALGILLSIGLFATFLAYYLSPIMMFPEDLMGDTWVMVYGGGTIPQTDGQYKTDTFSVGWLPGWTRVEIVDTEDNSVTWNWNLGSTTMYTYTLPQESCKRLGGVSLYLTFQHNPDSQWDYYEVSECRVYSKEETVVEGVSVLVNVSIQGPSCPNGEVVGYTYGYHQLDENFPVTYSLLGETETYEIDLSTQDTMINFQGYNEAGEPYGRYGDQTRVLHNATCAP